MPLGVSRAYSIESIQFRKSGLFSHFIGFSFLSSHPLRVVFIYLLNPIGIVTKEPTVGLAPTTSMWYSERSPFIVVVLDMWTVTYSVSSFSAVATGYAAPTVISVVICSHFILRVERLCFVFCK